MACSAPPDDLDLTLPQWFGAASNAYFCGLIGRQLRARAQRQRRAGNLIAAGEADAIAALIEQGEFQWLH